MRLSHRPRRRQSVQRDMRTSRAMLNTMRNRHTVFGKAPVLVVPQPPVVLRHIISDAGAVLCGGERTNDDIDKGELENVMNDYAWAVQVCNACRRIIDREQEPF